MANGWSPPPISDYALVGDTRTAALCSSEGSVDWMCIPRFDSEPIFGRLVGGEAAGCFSIEVVGGVIETSRRYRAGSAVLETTWRTGAAEVELTEGMVSQLTGSLLPQNLLVRRVECRGGRTRLRIRFDPRRGLPGEAPKAERRSGALVCTWGPLAAALLVRPELDLRPGEARSFDLEDGDSVTMALAVADRTPLTLLAPEAAYAELDATDTWWRRWADATVYEGPFREAVLRSLITLRLLTYSPSGAPVAAPTTSLPEELGGSRNWDYRLSWPRDASIGLSAFLAVGKIEEARSFLHWLTHASRLTRPRLEVLYSIHGKPGPRERELWDLPGYLGSRPVRVGNAASHQHQLDVYGWVLDAAWLFVRAGQHLPRETWRALSDFADFVADRWRDPDAGIWEVRGPRAHYVHSKLMAWLALDRATRIATSHEIRGHRMQRWSRESVALAEEIRTLGFDRTMGSYTWAYSSDELDAALLILPVLEFEDLRSNRPKGTIEAVREQLGAGGGLVYRYRPGVDRLEGVEGAFVPCSFWLAQALARVGEVDEAVAAFEELLGLSNDVGLLPEEIDPSSRDHLGNFPQAFSHAALIQAALAIDEASRGSGARREASRR
jgi:GH15 family glucan-1,4-alpha-glucosidase